MQLGLRDEIAYSDTAVFKLQNAAPTAVPDFLIISVFNAVFALSWQQLLVLCFALS